jgi:transmembrane sensor
VSANDNIQRPGMATMEDAADWVDRMDELSATERLALIDWLRASPTHAAAFASMRRILRDTALLDAADRVLREAETMRKVRVWRPFGLIAASLLALVGGSVLTVRVLKPQAVAPTIELATAIGARSDQTLEDQSVIHLNADTRASVTYGKAARDVRLHKGDAMFDVAKNPDRPFNVVAGDAKVTAVGTSFEVEMVSDAVEVRVFEGVVRVSHANAQPRMVAKGEWLILASNHKTTAGRFAPETYQGWRSDWLDADAMPLKYVVARLNRYTTDEVRLRDPAMGERKVTGRFKLNKTTDSLAMISALLEVDAAKKGRHVYLSPRQSH